MLQSVTVTGNPGVGKTVTMRNVSMKMEDEGYTVVPTKPPEDIRNFLKMARACYLLLMMHTLRLHGEST
jgi:nucleoside-triphosphatase THEP1